MEFEIGEKGWDKRELDIGEKGWEKMGGIWEKWEWEKREREMG